LAIASNDYQGPARLEVFGKDEHIGWVRASNERIDILTVEGEAIQVDTRARFRLTPITWQELANEGLREQKDRGRVIRRLREDVDMARKNIGEQQSRIDALRASIIQAQIDIQKAIEDGAPISKTPFIDVNKRLDEALGRDEQADEDKNIPF